MDTGGSRDSREIARQQPGAQEETHREGEVGGGVRLPWGRVRGMWRTPSYRRDIELEARLIYRLEALDRRIDAIVERLEKQEQLHSLPAKR